MPDQCYIITRGETYIMPLLATVDGYHSETHSMRLSTTSYPVESGGALTDNAVREPSTVRLSGVVSDVIPASHSSVYLGKDALAWNTMFTLMDTRALVDVITPIRWYRNMIITQCDTTRDVNTGANALRFEMSLREILRAESRIVVEAITDTTPAKGRDQVQDLGKTDAPYLAPLQLEVGDRQNYLGQREIEWLRPRDPETDPTGTPELQSYPNTSPNQYRPFSSAIPYRLAPPNEPLVFPEYTVTAPRIVNEAGNTGDSD